ncbi:unnamed protein product [Mytilus edulis]|uniref:Uncharacterized protein n=1 Tax=Mytilus edulis TaxID=6550 RepID=A0A8S3VG43_MYTED|nr:unnamed protein product [Mytilus edulis]
MNELLYLMSKDEYKENFLNADGNFISQLFVTVDGGGDERLRNKLTQFCAVILRLILDLDKYKIHSLAERSSKYHSVERLHTAENRTLSYEDITKSAFHIFNYMTNPEISTLCHYTRRPNEEWRGKPVRQYEIQPLLDIGRLPEFHYLPYEEAVKIVDDLCQLGSVPGFLTTPDFFLPSRNIKYLRENNPDELDNNIEGPVVAQSTTSVPVQEPTVQASSVAVLPVTPEVQSAPQEKEERVTPQVQSAPQEKDKY